jgi:alpha-L-fucosidase
MQEKEPGRPWLKKAPTSFAKDYRPEIDIFPELGTDDGRYYQSQIGVLRWMVELGRVDIITEVSSHLACPQEGHLEAVYRIFAYLNKKHNSCMVFDPTYPEIDMSTFKECNWKEFYTEAKEPLHPNIPEPCVAIVLD